MLMVLPLLPADYMAPGLEALRKWAQQKKVIPFKILYLEFEFIFYTDIYNGN